ncbi:uncharacterized protein LY89DRAFT_712021 [Mollisia scopiformis]|uniref:Rieske domain-containing protein n=1 Tax=Mollisia scopiformis TaxID=149040 RepID=A0A132B543_MOLSC|nr:uncharacterized protein LY89DRAFT_712021 [Mollisia scopiformis]KUJ07530.1 hypothetical protein LY89DRAFT_712021 [Mollisia scopiformis]
MPPRPGDAWFSAGPRSSYPNVTSTSLSDLLPCKDTTAPGCKVFHVPATDISHATEVSLDDTVTATSAELGEQVVVFQYQGQFYGIDHRCPHSSYPLSRGTPFDIEDFSVRLSAGIRCPKHDWSFDLIRGNGDRGNYRLKIWEVQLRPGQSKEGEMEIQVWVRRKQRIG